VAEGHVYRGRNNEELIASFEAQVTWFDDGKYLHNETRRICDLLLAEAGIHILLHYIMPIATEEPHKG
jgi:hypothetical protein